MQPEGVSNKGKSIMSHPGNSPNADGSPEKHRSDSLTTGKIGQLVEVYHKSGSMSRGHLQHGADGIVLEMPSALLKQATGEFERLPPTKTVNIPAHEISKVVYVEKHLWRCGEEEDEMLSGVNGAYDPIKRIGTELWTRSLATGDLHAAEVIPSFQNYELSSELEEFQIKWRKEESVNFRRPTNVANDVPEDIPTHGYGPGSFSLHGLPDPYLGEVMGLLGGKSTGKTTSLLILAGLVKPNLGRLEDPPEWDEIIAHFDTDHIKTYLTRLQSNTLKVALKAQDVTSYKSALTVRTCLEESKGVDFESMEELIDGLDMSSLLDRPVDDLSDAELQRFAIASTVVQSAEAYLFDEPTIFLDAMQKYQVARLILSVVKKPSRYVFVTDNDMSVLDLICDSITCTGYGGEGTSYIEVQFPHHFENHIGDFPEIVTPPTYRYPERVVKGFGTCGLHVMGGDLRSSEITVVLGNMHSGKTLFLVWLWGTDTLRVISYKQQNMILCEKKPDTVATHLYSLIPSSFVDRVFQELVLKPLGLVKILDKRIKEVSQSTLQKIAISTCLGQEGARVFLLDEPSIHLDARERVIAFQTIKRFISHTRTTALVVEQDVMMATYLADRVIIVQGEPGVQSTVHSPVSMSIGINSYLSDLNITCRTDPFTSIARMNKPGSVEDMEQRASGRFFEDSGRRVRNLGRVQDLA